MIQRGQWKVIIPAMVISEAGVFFGLKLLQLALPQAFPHIQGPPLPTFAVVCGVWIVAYVLIVRPMEPAMNRQPWFRGLVMGVSIGIFMFVQGLIT